MSNLPGDKDLKEWSPGRVNKLLLICLNSCTIQSSNTSTNASMYVKLCCKQDKVESLPADGKPKSVPRENLSCYDGYLV